MKKRITVAVQLGKRVRELRKGQELTQAALAERARLHVKFLSDVEVGNRDVRLTTLMKLSKGLDVELLDLFRWGEQDELLGEIEGLILDRQDPVVRGHLLRLVREALLMLDSAS